MVFILMRFIAKLLTKQHDNSAKDVINHTLTQLILYKM